MIIPIKFKGFIPSEQIKTEAEETLLHLEDHSPASSTLRMIVAYGEQEYRTMVEVYTRKGLVKISASEEDVLTCLASIKTSFIEKFGRVKETRFFSRIAYLPKRVDVLKM